MDRQEVSLRELMEEKFKSLERRVAELTRAIETLAAATVSKERFDSTYNRVIKLEQALSDMDNRLDKAESYIGIWRYLGAAIVTVITALVIAWLAGRMGA